MPSSTASLLEAIEKRTQKTYRYGIGLVCFGATLNWLGFAQGNSYIDPLRYLGVACVISGSFCVCMAMCRWLGRPISLSTGIQEEDSGLSDVHIINVAVPLFLSPQEYRPSKPPDYEIVARDPPPPPYEEAIKLNPASLVYEPPATPSHSILFISNEQRKSIDSSSGEESQPPPYSVSSMNLLNAADSGDPQYRLSAEQEHLLGLMMQGHNSNISPSSSASSPHPPNVNAS